MRVYSQEPIEYSKIWIPDGVYKSDIIKVSDEIGTEGFGGEPRESIVITHRVYDKKKQPYEVPQFVNAIVSKGTGDYKNSQLYDILELAGKVKEFYKEYDGLDKEVDLEKWVLDYFRGFLLEKPCEVQVKTIKKNTPEKYSAVHKILKLLAETG